MTSIPLADHDAGKAVHGDGATGDTGDKRVGLGRGDAPIPTEEAPTYGSYHRGYEGHERLVRVTREVDHVKHGMGHGRGYVCHAHEADEVEDGARIRAVPGLRQRVETAEAMALGASVAPEITVTPITRTRMTISAG